MKNRISIRASLARISQACKTKNFSYMPVLFEDNDKELKEIEKDADTYNFDAQFHDQLKAILLIL